MSGSGRKVFAPGEVLTASNVQNYLMDQAVQVYAGTAARGSAIGTATSEGMMSYLADTNSVQMATGTATWVNVDSLPIVGGTAERAALYPSPVQGNTVWRNDVKYMETYHTASGTAAAGWYSGQNGGLVPIIPESITVGSGSATVSENGFITFSGTSSISLNSIFSSKFENYKIIWKSNGTTDSGTSMRFRTTGTDNTTAVYNFHLAYWGATGVGNIITSNANTIGGIFGHAYQNADIQIFRPNLAEHTGLTWYGVARSTANNTEQHTSSAIFKNTTVFDGITFYPGSGTQSGTLQIFGFRK